MTRSPVALVFIALMLGLFFAIWWQIFKKAGYSGALGLLMIVPIVNFILLLYLAFSDWPIHRDLRSVARSPDAPA